jgi:hypothetical protein
MKLICVLWVAVANAFQFPQRLILASRSMTAQTPVVATASTTTGTVDRSVSGMCSAAQDAVGVLKDANSAGISTLSQCAQFGKDRNSGAVYVSFSASLGSCMWFKDCQCLASSSTCLGGDQWRSVAIGDLVVSTSSAVIQTTSSPISKSAIVSNNGKPVNAAQSTSSNSDLDCDTTNSNSLMQSFQTKCEMTQSVWTTRLVAGSTLAVVVLLIAGIFGAAFYFDKQELNSLSAK